MTLAEVESEINTANPGIERVKFRMKTEAIFCGVDLRIVSYRQRIKRH